MTNSKVILPGATIGILGGGQLGRMLAFAAQQMGYKIVGYTPEANSPLSEVAPQTICAPFEDEATLRKFAEQVDVVTIEFENIPSKALEQIESQTNVRPGPAVLHTTQNRAREKAFLTKHKFPVVPYAEVNSLEDLRDAAKKIGMPAVLKTAGFGYDGKGQKYVASLEEAEKVYPSFQSGQCVLEKFISFEKEISVIGARSLNGDFVAYGPIENEHRNHILDLSFAPARVSWTQGEEAIDITRSIMDTLNVVGLLCVEFFVGEEETLMVNELVPRPHNSGHYSIEGCPTSQFEQLVRAITGLPLGTTEHDKGVAMAQLLGDLWADGEPDWASAVALPEVHLHLYGKKEARAGRKMGHLTACARWADEAVSRVTSARELLTRVKA